MTSILSLAGGRTKVAAAGFGKDGGKRKSQLEAWVPGTAGSTVTVVEISISCRNLADKDLLSKSDPICVLYNRPPGSKGWVQAMRTEVINNDLDPDFAAKAVMEYRFEQVQMLRFEVYDIDNEAVKLSSSDMIGFVEVTLSQIVSAGQEGLTVELTSVNTAIIAIDSDKPAGTIILIAEELASEKDEVHLKLMGNNCGAWRGCFPPKSLFALSKINDAGKYLVVHRSKVARGVNPTWQPLRISSNKFCGGDEDRELNIEVYKQFAGGIESIGSVRTTLNKMLRSSEERMPLVSPQGQPTNSAIRIGLCALQPINTFIDFIQSGTQIHCSFAIDFTCSNGDPTDNQSLHFVSNTGNAPNPYEQAIQAVGTIVKDYDNTSAFAAYGFGARIPPRGDISHNFPITLEKSPNCSSVPGVLEAYRACISKIQLWGPTNFAPVINTVAQLAGKSKPGENYHILVIITDGVISDMVKTKKAIVDASVYPLSIIIIGVGEADFDAMEELDGDAVRISYKGKFAQRDIVQFVAYRSARSWMSNTGETMIASAAMNDYGASAATEEDEEDEEAADVAPAEETPVPEGSEGTQPPTQTKPQPPPQQPPEVEPTPINDPNANANMGAPEDKNEKTNRLAQSQLAQEVLSEIPEQLTGYMRNKNIVPMMIKCMRQNAGKSAGGGAAGTPTHEEAPTE